MRQMRPTVLHLRDPRVRIIRMRPVVVRALVLAFQIDPRQVGTRRRPNARRLGKIRQKLLVALAAVSPYDAPQRRVRFKRRRVNADRLALHQAGRTQALQHPGKDGAVCFKIDQATGARDGRVVRGRIFQTDAQKVAQGEGVRRDATRCRAPNRSLRNSQSTTAGSTCLAAGPAVP